jgi:hypothetical protein
MELRSGSPKNDAYLWAKETYLDLWARWLAWFDEYVKADGEVTPRPTESESGGAP